MSEMIMACVPRLSLEDRMKLFEIARDTNDEQLRRYALMELARYYDPPLEVFRPYMVDEALK